MAFFRPALNKHNRTEQQWRIIRISRQQGTPESHQLAHHACILVPSMTGVLSRLERDGLVHRQKSGHGVHHCAVYAQAFKKNNRFFLTRAVSDRTESVLLPRGELMFSLPMHCGSSSMIGLSWKR
ncbi:MarR family transcriptional regulator [Pseudomonas brassicacearum]